MCRGHYVSLLPKSKSPKTSIDTISPILKCCVWILSTILVSVPPDKNAVKPDATLESHDVYLVGMYGLCQGIC